ncbi:transposase [Aneurinibacillus aneurinilyticus]|uniref:Transposase n=2 Tax=Aneurinibacillus aneurinilyticus TaxID=1391 RepID=A0A848D1U1_ANEAE|nr:transposase [Aneurinibacillus aneurinilyticus]
MILGYFSLDGLKSIHEQGGYYISRVKHNVKIYFTKERTEEPKCAEDFIKDLAPGETMEVHHVSISQKRIPQPRLILYRLTEKQERDREEKWNQRRKKRKHTSKHRQTHPIYAYITNTSVKEIAKEAVYALYSLRWQIEILCKVWKSILISSSVTFKIRSFLYQKEKRRSVNIKPCTL